MERESRIQLARLPSAAPDGKVRYLDLVVWRINLRLKARRDKPEPSFLRAFFKACILAEQRRRVAAWSEWAHESGAWRWMCSSLWSSSMLARSMANPSALEPCTHLK